MNFFARIFDTSDFPARWHCGNWSAEHGWLHILSDLGVWSAYLAIPFVLVYFIARRKDLPFRKIFLLFGAFILACGTTHLMEAIIFWWPAYRLAGGIKLLTAVVSWATVVAIVPVVPRVLSMRSPEELQREIELRKKAERALQQANDELERRIGERTAELAAANAKLAQERERFRTTLACIGDAVIATDTAGNITFLNSMAVALTGCSPEQAEGSRLDDVFQIVDEPSGRPLENPARQALARGTTVALTEHTILVGKDGVRRSIDDSAAPIRDSAGAIVGRGARVSRRLRQTPGRRSRPGQRAAVPAIGRHDSPVGLDRAARRRNHLVQPPLARIHRQNARRDAAARAGSRCTIPANCPR